MAHKRKSRVGLALAGGGIGGAIYEIGALRALEDALDGLNFNEVDVYVGVSAGSFISSCLANQFTTGQLCRTILERDPYDRAFRPELFHRPAFNRFLMRGMSVPGLLWDSLWDYAKNYQQKSLMGALSRLFRALPSGLFDNEPLHRYLQKIFSYPNRTNDFRQLRQRLLVVATDLDSSDAAVFGAEGLDHVPISKAVQASTALPGLYPPVLIDDRYYVDGVLLKTMHASVALAHGAELLICLNPIVPVNTARSVEEGYMVRGKLIDRGLLGVLSQSIRTMIHSRMNVGWKLYKTTFKDADTILFEPRKEDYRMFFANVFTFSSRQMMCEHGYRSVLKDLRERREELEPVFNKHGISMRDDVVDDPTRTLWDSVPLNAKGLHKIEATWRLNKALSRLETLLEHEEPAADVSAP